MPQQCSSITMAWCHYGFRSCPAYPNLMDKHPSSYIPTATTGEDAIPSTECAPEEQEILQNERDAGLDNNYT